MFKQKFLNKWILSLTLVIIALFSLYNFTIKPNVVFAEGNPFIPNTDYLNTGLSAEIGASELAQASYTLSSLKDITGAYYDATNNRVVFIGTTTGSNPYYDQDDMYEAVHSVLTNNTLPSVSIDDIPSNPASSTANVNYTGGIQNTSFASKLFNADYKLKQYALGATSVGGQVTSSVPTYKSVVARYLTLQPSPVAGNKSRYIVSPQQIAIKTATSSSAFVFTNVTMKVTAEALSVSNDTLWNTAANNFATDLTSNYNSYASETPHFVQAQQLAKLTAIVKWVQDYSIPTDALIAKNYTPQFISTPTTIQKIATSSGYVAQGGINYNTPNSYIPDDGSASGLKTSAQAGSSSNQDVAWTFTNGGITYTAVAVTAGAFKSIGSFNTSVSDISVAASGEAKLEFNRSYSSFNHGQNGIGIGWDFIPAKFYPNSANPYLDITLCGGNIYDNKVAIDTIKGHETFTFSCPSGYIADDQSYHSKVTESNNGSTASITLTDQTKYNFTLNTNFVNDTLIGFQLSQILDKHNNPINYTYASPSGQLTSIADAKSHSITVSYNAQKLISSVADWTGRSVQYTYDASGSGRLISVQDPGGNATAYTYDNKGRVATITDRNGQLALTNTYNSDDRIATSKDALNLTNTYTYDNVNKKITLTDSNSRVKQTTYDAKARILTQIDPANNTLSYTYASESAPLTYTDRNNKQLTFTYDSNGNMLSVKFPDNFTINYTYNNSNRLTKTLDSRYSPTKQSDFTYNATNDLTQASSSGQIYKYAYNSAGDMITSTDPLNNVTTYTTDTFGNIITSKDPYNKITTYTYDSLGRRTQIIDPNNKVMSYAYDVNDNLKFATNSAGTTSSTFDKEDQLTKITLPDNTITQFTYNNVGAMTSVIDALNNTSSYGYDSYNNLTSQQNALNNITSSAFNNLNRQTSSTTPLGKVTSWQYDANGNTTQLTDPNNNIVTYTYDSLNKLTKVASASSSINYYYDARGNMTGMSDAQGSASAVFDSLDRMTKYTNEAGDVIEYSYDLANNLKTLKYPDSKVVQYTYDNNNRMTNVKDWNNNNTSYTYNDNSTIATRSAASGINTSYTYDGANRLSAIEHKQSSTTRAKFSYVRNSVGNITIATESGTLIIGGPYQTTYYYDNLGRITSYQSGTGNRNGSGTFTYDKVGNIATDSAKSRTFTFDADNKLTSLTDGIFGTFNQTYDANGNWTTKRENGLTKNITYDFANRMTKYGTSDTYTYDGLGNRLTSSYNTTRYITDINSPLPRVLADYDTSSPGISNYYVYGANDELIAEFQGGSSALDSNYNLEDGYGNTRFLHNSSFGTTSIMHYGPYGDNIYQSGGNPKMAFDAQRRDDNSNFYYLRARYYDPSVNRFISRDPIPGNLTNPLSQNAYQYAYDNPLNLSDPTGEAPKTGFVWVDVTLNVIEGVWKFISRDGDPTNEARAIQAAQNAQKIKIPAKAKEVFNYVMKKNGAAPQGLRGGSVYRNDNNLLPKGGNYKEYDIYPKVRGVNRPPDRIVIDTNTGKAWYTPDHYTTTFVPIN